MHTQASTHQLATRW